MESIKEFNTDIFKLFDDHWALVTAGTPEDYNTMTISWGSLGTIWAPRGNGRQIATIYIKPSRYTFATPLIIWRRVTTTRSASSRKKSARISPISAAILAAMRTSSLLQA